MDAVEITPYPFGDYEESHTLRAESDDASVRVDVFVVQRLPFLSRSFVQRLIATGSILRNGDTTKANVRLRAGDCVEVTIPPPEPSPLLAEPIPLDIVYEDGDIIVVDKPAGMVVHPAAGVSSGTLVNALLHHCKDLQGVGGVQRPGIVHRLDRDTSGLLAIAKSDTAHRSLAGQFKAHSTERVYAALVVGSPPDAGIVDASLGRSVRDRTRIAVGGVGTRHAVTRFVVLERFGFSGFGSFAHLDLRLETGRTHQIRVHLAHIGFPVVGDPTYGGGARRAVRGCPPALRPLFENVNRQLLHARRLGFEHPRTGERLTFDSPLPEDFRRVLDGLRSLGWTTRTS